MSTAQAGHSSSAGSSKDAKDHHGKTKSASFKISKSHNSPSAKRQVHIRIFSSEKRLFALRKDAYQMKRLNVLIQSLSHISKFKNTHATHTRITYMNIHTQTDSDEAHLHIRINLCLYRQPLNRSVSNFNHTFHSATSCDIRIFIEKYQLIRKFRAILH